jgi:hypothetical protein
MLTLKITARYTRYLLSTLATVTFGTTMNLVHDQATCWGMVRWSS